jgi:hypothetical protein
VIWASLSKGLGRLGRHNRSIETIKLSGGSGWVRAPGAGARTFRRELLGNSIAALAVIVTVWVGALLIHLCGGG